MIRKNSCGNISDEEFLNIVIPFDRKMDKYLIKYMYEYVAHYLAVGFEMSALWECTLEQQVNSALTRFTDPLLDGIFNYDNDRNVNTGMYSPSYDPGDVLDLTGTFTKRKSQIENRVDKI